MIRSALALAFALASGSASAFEPPVVDENMGTLKLEYPLNIPPARGRYQPDISLQYDSKFDGGEAVIARGWCISPQGTLHPEPGNATPARYFYNPAGSARRLLVASQRDPGQYAVDVEDGYMVFREVDALTWEATDAIGNTYTFTTSSPYPGAAHSLTRVVDPDNNATVFVYGPGGLQSIQYNAYNPSATSPTNPVDGPFATVIDFEYGTGTTGYTGHRLRNIRVKTAGPQGLVTIRRYELGYSSYDRYDYNDGWLTIPRLESIREIGGDNGVSLPPARFGYVDRTTLIQSIVSSLGARWDVLWTYGTDFGDVQTYGYMVVKSITTTGPGLAARTIEYWYSDCTRYDYLVWWYDPATMESGWDFRGFLQAWSHDSATNVVRHVWWESAHAFQGKEAMIEFGTFHSPGTSTEPPTYLPFRRLKFENSAKSINASSCTAVSYDSNGVPRGMEVAAANYPVVPFRLRVEDAELVNGLSLTSTQTVACADVDAFGNVKKVTVDPDVLVTDDGYREEATFEIAADPSAMCKDCVRELTRKTLAGALLEATWHTYGPTYLLTSVRKKAEPSGAYVTVATWSYNADGNLSGRTEGGVTRSYTYDEPYQLRVVREEMGDAASATIPKIVTDTQYDAFGRPELVTGPYVAGTTGARMQRGMAYDALGRLLVVARDPIAGPIVTRATEAFNYPGGDATPTSPTSTEAYRFAVPKEYNTTQGDPLTDDVRLTISYFDGLGREIQVREQLGRSGGGDPSAQIVQHLGQYRVVKAILLDGAGRETASLEPYYSLSSAFVDLSSAAVDKSGGTVHATLTTYDARGAVTCRARRFVQTSVAAAAMGSCVSSFGNSSSFALATAVTYRGVHDGAANRNYLAVKTIPPENNVGTSPAGPESFLDADGRLLWTTDAEGNTTRFFHDALGRNTGMSREVAGGSRPAMTTAIVPDLMGRTKQRIDPNIGTRTFTYDTARPALLQKIVFNKTGQEIRFTYDKGRIEQICTASSATSSCTTDSMWKYDLPYLPSGYEYTAGKLSYAYNQNTTIAFGYDDGGAAVRRDQWLAGMPTGTSGAFSWV